MPKFIYVYDKAARDRLNALKYQLLKSDEQNNVYVFVHDGRMDFEAADLSYILSDVLTF